MTGAGIISIDGIWFGYDGPGRAVLRDLTLDVPAGSVTAILGPNGAGKTTLMHLILGLLTPQRGQIRLAGRTLGQHGRRELGRLMALVPQDEYNPFGYSVLEYVLLGRAPYLSVLAVPGEADRRMALEALEAVEMGHLRDRPIPSLSGGERQLVAVARALAQQPRILLLDEPTAHLDLGNKARLLRLVRDLAAAGVTVVLNTHSPDVAAGLADLVVLMRQGQVMDAGPTAAMLTADRLSATYGVPVEVVEVAGRRVILLP